MKRLLLAALFVSTAYAGDLNISTGSGEMVVSQGSGTIALSLVASGGCSGAFFEDTFTEDGSGTIEFTTHTPESGGSWVRTEADGELIVDRTSDEIRSTVSDGDTKLGYWTGSASCADYFVSATAKAGGVGSSNRVGVLGRWDPAAGGSGYRFRIEGDGTARLERVVNGTASDLDTDAVASFSSSTYYTIELRMSGSTIQGYVNGALECVAIDSTHSSPGTVGVLVRNNAVRMTTIGATYL